MLDSLPTNVVASHTPSSSSSSSSSSSENGSTSSEPVDHVDKTSSEKSVESNSTSLDAFNSTVMMVDPKNESVCSIVLFYYPWCIFSAEAAPHFNAIGRLFPGLHVLALDAYTNNG